eukprot:GHVU01069556.1.p1 GENE.GHVU01069556.1~~GHVU01069556.1.p1  ORF type:complete len:215 (-),score=30.12 GHVU01069556.1:746-1390(-)
MEVMNSLRQLYIENEKSLEFKGLSHECVEMVVKANHLLKSMDVELLGLEIKTIPKLYEHEHRTHPHPTTSTAEDSNVTGAVSSSHTGAPTAQVSINLEALPEGPEGEDREQTQACVSNVEPTKEQGSYKSGAERSHLEANTNTEEEHRAMHANDNPVGGLVSAPGDVLAAAEATVSAPDSDVRITVVRSSTAAVDSRSNGHGEGTSPRNRRGKV